MPVEKQTNSQRELNSTPAANSARYKNTEVKRGVRSNEDGIKMQMDRDRCKNRGLMTHITEVCAACAPYTLLVHLYSSWWAHARMRDHSRFGGEALPPPPTAP